MGEKIRIPLLPFTENGRGGIFIVIPVIKNTEEGIKECRGGYNSREEKKEEEKRDNIFLKWVDKIGKVWYNNIR